MSARKLSKGASPLTIVIGDKQWKRERDLAQKLERAAVLTLTSLPEALLPVAGLAQATLLLTSNDVIKQLNHDFRGLNRSTNVLSFPHLTKTQLSKLGKGKEPVYIGDIAIGYRFTVDEARKDGKVSCHHVTHLLIHGLLHLFGYDHLTGATAAQMERLEKKLMKKLGLPDPYALLPRKGKASRSMKRARA